MLKKLEEFMAARRFFPGEKCEFKWIVFVIDQAHSGVLVQFPGSAPEWIEHADILPIGNPLVRELFGLHPLETVYPQDVMTANLPLSCYVFPPGAAIQSIGGYDK